MSEKKYSTTALILGGFVGFILLAIISFSIWFISARNGFINNQENINAAWAQVENQLQRRYLQLVHLLYSSGPATEVWIFLSKISLVKLSFLN